LFFNDSLGLPELHDIQHVFCLHVQSLHSVFLAESLLLYKSDQVITHHLGLSNVFHLVKTAGRQQLALENRGDITIRSQSTDKGLTAFVGSKVVARMEVGLVEPVLEEVLILRGLGSRKG